MMEMVQSTQGQRMKPAKKKALGSNCTQMEDSLLATGVVTKLMDKDAFSFLTETHIKENGTKTKCTETELTSTRMAPSMLVYGKTI